MIDVELDVGGDAAEPARTRRPTCSASRTRPSATSPATRRVAGDALGRRGDGRRPRFVIRDNGRGFDPLARWPAGSATTDCPTCDRRIATIGGTMTIASDATGTTIEVRRWRRRRRHRAEPRHMTETPTERPLTLLVVDDHEVVRQGLVSLLDRRPASRSWPRPARWPRRSANGARFEPDLVIMDVRLPDGSGIEACREIRAELPETRVVILTSYPDEEAVIAAIVAGASGYLLKQVRARDLVAALEAVGRGESLLDPAVTGKVLERMRRIATSDQPDELGALTAAGAQDPGARRRGQDQQGDRGRGLPVGQDRQELRQLDPRQAQPQPMKAASGQRPNATPKASGAPMTVTVRTTRTRSGGSGREGRRPPSGGVRGG